MQTQSKQADHGRSQLNIFGSENKCRRISSIRKRSVHLSLCFNFRTTRRTVSTKPDMIPLRNCWREREIADFHKTHISLQRARRFFKNLPLRIVWETHDIPETRAASESGPSAAFKPG